MNKRSCLMVFRSALGAAVFSMLTSVDALGQWWAEVGVVSGANGNFFALYGSPDGETVYYGGTRDFDPITPGWQNALVKCTVSGVEIIPAPGEIYSIAEFHDTLFIGGTFETNPAGSDTIPAYDVEYWMNGGWHRMGVFDDWGVRSLRVLDDTLYAVGSFGMIDSVVCEGMARLINGHWQPLPPLPEPDPLGASVMDIIKYDGKLIVTGPIYIDGEYVRIAYLDGNTWHTLGPGLEAGFSSVRCMRLYQGDLYVGGQIAITENNPGRDIMRWDGTAFHKLGAVGLQTDLGDDSWFSTVGGMVEHDGLLYVGGGFRFAGGNPSKGVATWNGTEWCSVPGNLSDGAGYAGVWGTAFLEDTMFVICGPLADGDSVNLAAKFIGESYAGPCESDVNVVEVAASPGLSILPNPATSRIRFTPASDHREQIKILDALGRFVVQLSGQVTELDVSMWPRGIYIAHSTTRPPVRFVLH